MQTLIQITHYIPIVTTIISFAFTVILFQHWQRKPEAAYLLWWSIGAFLFGIGTLTEAYTGLFGWNNFVLKSWYISGALMGGAPLAQGTVYLLFKKKTANIMAAVLIVYTLIASICVALSPIDAAADHFNLTGRGTFEWTWVRAFSPFSNTYALIFLVGFMKKRWHFTYSYDFTVSGLGAQSGGSSEISLSFLLKDFTRETAFPFFRPYHDYIGQ